MEKRLHFRKIFDNTVEIWGRGEADERGGLQIRYSLVWIQPPSQKKENISGQGFGGWDEVY